MFTTGEIVGLAEWIIDDTCLVLIYAFFFSTAPIQISLTCYLIYVELEFAVFAAIFVLIISIPLNIIAGGISKRYQIVQMRLKDSRVKLINEVRIMNDKICLI